MATLDLVLAARRLGNSVEDFWYVFSKRERKYPNGKRPSRSTGTDGRWKPVGQNKEIKLGSGKEVIGHKCELAYEVFVHYDNKSQGSKRSRRRLEKTEWKMCEFVAENTNKPISSAPDKMLVSAHLTYDINITDCIFFRRFFSK
jgi:hypothetical protein